MPSEVSIAFTACLSWEPWVVLRGNKGLVRMHCTSKYPGSTIDEEKNNFESYLILSSSSLTSPSVKILVILIRFVSLVLKQDIKCGLRESNHSSVLRENNNMAEFNYHEYSLFIIYIMLPNKRKNTKSSIVNNQQDTV